MGTPDRVQQQIEHWARDLIDLTRRNRSLFYRPTKRTTLEIAGPPAAKLFTMLVKGKDLGFFHPPSSEISALTLEQCLAAAGGAEVVSKRTEPGDLLKTLQSLARYSDQDLMDRGVHTLYACFGMLEWHESADASDAVRTPLVFVPVSLLRESPRDPFRLQRAPEDVVLNPSLVVKLDHDYGIDLRVAVEAAEESDSLDEILSTVERSLHPHEWAVRPATLIKRSTFHKETMYRDLLENLGEVSAHSVVRALAGDSTGKSLGDLAELPDEARLDTVAPPEKAHLILDADASQRRAVTAALQGASFVMDGPPGTGKSQTIANMIAELMAAGRTVLFVSEKAAALEVVAKRLRERGLDDYVFELHSHKASRKEVVGKLAESLARHPRPEEKLGESTLRRAGRRRRELSRYAAAVNERREPLQRSLHWIVGRLTQLSQADVLAVPTLSEDLSDELLSGLLERFDQLASVWAPVDDPSFAWHGFQSHGLGVTNREALLRLLGQVQTGLEDVQELADELAFGLGLPEVEHYESVEGYLTLRAHLDKQPDTHALWWTTATTQPLWERSFAMATQLDERRSAIGEIEQFYPDGAWQRLGDLLDRDEVLGVVDDLRRIFGDEVAQVPMGTPGVDGALACFDVIEQELNLIDGLLRRVLASLGLPERDRGLAELARLATVAEASDSAIRPEASWVSAAAIARVREAIAVLGPLQARFAQQQEELDSVFTDGIYELDLPTVRVRLQRTTGIRKLGKGYREAKSQLRAVTRVGRVDRAVLEHLPDAVGAVETRRALDEREVLYGEVLGRFYQPRATDAEEVERALMLLEDVLDKLGHEADPAKIAAQYAGDGPQDPDLGRSGARLSQSVRSILSQLQALGPMAPASNLSLRLLRASVVEKSEVLRNLGRFVACCAPVRNTTPSAEELVEDATYLAQVRVSTERIEASASTDRELFGILYGGLQTDVPSLQAALGWVDGYRELLGGPAEYRQVERCRRDASQLPDVVGLQAAVTAFETALGELLTYFDSSRRVWLGQQLAGRFVEGLDLVAELQDRIDEADVWLDFSGLMADLDAAGFSATLAHAQQLTLPSERLASALERATLSAWADEQIGKESSLRRLRPQERSKAVSDFQRLDRRLLDDASERVISACNQRRPRTTVGPTAVIHREAQKKRRHMPVRTLLERVVDVATALKPCFMMSPLSVSQFMPSSYRFDVVIFDEASQIPPADAINCIYRGRQLIIAGDDRQLPPTTFFEASMDEVEVYDDEQFDDFESILGLCKGTELLDSIPLKWHYRSQHEDLITFSNYRFYEGQLVTYPGADTVGPDLGVELFICQGIYRRGGRRDNPVEAAKVVDRVLYHARAHPSLTLGVVALSRTQAEAIEDLLDRARTEHPELDEYFAVDRLDGFFVKNLENVQGDERDVILLSIGYGPDEAQRFTMNFGPLNREGGWRRLNVAITRARRRLEVVASFGPEQMRVEDSRSRGVAELHRYLEYVQQGPPALALDIGDQLAEVESPFEAEVLRTLTAWGYDVVPRVGTAGYRIDLGVRDPVNPRRFLLGVECDGASYHSSKVARDRDRLRQQVLEGLGWTLHRVWGPSWYRHREIAEEDLRFALERAEQGASSSALSTPASSTTVRQADTVDLSDLPSWVASYRAHRPRAQSVGRADSALGRAKVHDIVRKVVVAESPVHREVVGRRVATAFNQNLTRRLQSFVDAALKDSERQGNLKMKGDFAWISDEVVVRVPVEGKAQTRRDIQHIPPEEVAAAVHQLLCEARSADESELLDAVKRLFGFDRLGPRVQAALDDALISLEQAGLVTRTTTGQLTANGQSIAQ